MRIRYKYIFNCASLVSLHILVDKTVRNNRGISIIILIDSQNPHHYTPERNSSNRHNTASAGRLIKANLFACFLSIAFVFLKINGQTVRNGLAYIKFSRIIFCGNCGQEKRKPPKGVYSSTKYPQKIIGRRRFFSVDIVNNYLCNRVSPIFTTSPAPIVINRSSFVQFSERNFSIASKEGK